MDLIFNNMKIIGKKGVKIFHIIQYKKYSSILTGFFNHSTLEIVQKEISRGKEPIILKLFDK